MKINIITLGCSKNTVDSEQLAAKLKNNGFEIVHNSENLDFDIAIVNTCGFIDAAKEQSINAILFLINAKKNKQLRKIIVFGCLAERFMDSLKTELPEVDIFLGNYNADEILKSLNINKKNNKYERIFENQKHFAYLKIAEGCSRNCSFCAIPLIKGKYISRPENEILEEANFLAKNGVKEIILIAQDICYYGFDIEKQFLLPDLIEKLSQISGIEWIRLHYLYPFLFPEKLISIIKENPKVCKYIDIPLQHISNKVLKAMNRGGTKEQTINLLEKIRKEIPKAAIRTTFLLGHPEEENNDFNELLDFVKIQKFDRLGVFTYSEEEGTASQKNYHDLISARVKNSREKKIMELQSDISFKLNQQKIGKTYKVIIDSKTDDENYIGRTEYDSPDVDNEVLIFSQKPLLIGNFYQVKIIETNEFELIGSCELS
ncbi:MAG: 30S ribosomal protein S12 methylthiotransferase RimO [Bacteroidales bacterium]|jgi:ribosomal protein S12 methylthiotransferase|nr:30S ribosomal protein S12 methylthiotransferase RimO [Bacteroidales bacterium]